MLHALPLSTCRGWIVFGGHTDKQALHEDNCQQRSTNHSLAAFHKAKCSPDEEESS